MASFNKQDGRYYIRRPNHPRSTYRGYVERAILIMEDKLGRFLNPGEVVHHINGDCTDDRFENLQVITREDHTSLHKAGLKLKRHGSAWNRLPDWKIKEIYKLKNVGYNYFEIAKFVGVRDVTVRKYILQRSACASDGKKILPPRATSENTTF